MTSSIRVLKAAVVPRMSVREVLENGCMRYRNHRQFRRLQICNAPLKIQAQGTCLFTKVELIHKRSRGAHFMSVYDQTI